jgi:hypothetical protein
MMDSIGDGNSGGPLRRILLAALLSITGVALAHNVWLTAHQPVWWDEAEYLLEAKHLALGTPETGFADLRPILFPLALSGFYKAGLGVVAIRVALAITSLLSVYVLFLVGEQLYSAVAGAAGAALYALFYMNLFYSARILTEVPHVLLALLGVFLFRSRRPSFILLSAPAFVLAILTRTQSVFLFLAVLALALLTERSVFEDKNCQRSFLLGAGIFACYLAWQQWKFGEPLHSISAEIRANASRLDLTDRIEVLWEFLRGYTLLLPNSILLFSAIGVLSPSAWRGRFRSHLFLVLWWLMPTIGYGLLADHFEDRYAILAYAPIFLWAALGVVALCSSLARYHRALALVTTGVLVAFMAFRLWQRSNLLVHVKLKSFAAVEQAGIWIKQNSDRESGVISQSVPQITYYSERPTRSFPTAEAEFLQLLKNTHPRFIVVSPYERLPPWVGPAGAPEAPGYSVRREFSDEAGRTVLLSN